MIFDFINVVLPVCLFGQYPVALGYKLRGFPMLVVHSVTAGMSVHFSSASLFSPEAYVYLTWFEKVCLDIFNMLTYSHEEGVLKFHFCWTECCLVGVLWFYITLWYLCLLGPEICRVLR